jgi:hypothetical protein
MSSGKRISTPTTPHFNLQGNFVAAGTEKTDPSFAQFFSIAPQSGVGDYSVALAVRRSSAGCLASLRTGLAFHEEKAESS